MLNAIAAVHVGPKQLVLQSLQLLMSSALMAKNEISDPFLQHISIR